MSDMSDFADAHHVERLRQSLWSGQAFGRAAVLVGAGLSQNAERLNPASLPLLDFSQLAAEMWGELNEEPAQNAPPLLDPKELASEYEGVFHRHALNDFLRRKLVDGAYRPARIHRLLLSLPWADVFTTNWDTLLERAATDVVDRQYAVVATAEALVGSQRPRVVKLHGSFPDRLPLIVTKEDFRSYPRTHATFVNTVQQAVMECSVCLIGFSGNDPNFLAWSGWVHDHLGASTPPVYLAGILDLNTRQRMYLQHCRVVPIDLAGLFPKAQWPDAQTRHRVANEWFLLNLAQGEPDPMMWPSLERREASGAWSPEPGLPPLLHRDAQTAPSATSPAHQIVEMLDRYPGWLTCPESAGLSLETSIRADWENLRFALESQDRAVAQPAWLALMRAADILRKDVALTQLAQLRTQLEAWHDATDEWFELGRRYLAHLRYSEQWDEHKLWLERLLRTHGDSELRQAHLRREQSLSGLARLDYAAVRQALQQWPALPGAFQLELARAAVLVEVHEVKDAIAIVETVLHSIRTLTVPVQGKLELLALEGVAMAFPSLARLQLRDLNWRHGPYGRYRELARWDCEPSEYFEAAEHDLRQVPLDPVRITKAFDIGAYNVHWSYGSALDEHRRKAGAALRLFEAFSLRLGLSQAQESISRLIRGLRSNNDLEVRSAASGIVVWLETDAQAPRELLSEFIAVLQRPGPRSFSFLVRRLARFVDASPNKITPSEIGRLVSTLDALLDETDVTNEQNDRLYIDPAWMPDARVASTYLAAVLWKNFPNCRQLLERWHASALADPIPEARETWREVTASET